MYQSELHSYGEPFRTEVPNYGTQILVNSSRTQWIIICKKQNKKNSLIKILLLSRMLILKFVRIAIMYLKTKTITVLRAVFFNLSLSEIIFRYRRNVTIYVYSKSLSV